MLKPVRPFECSPNRLQQIATKKTVPYLSSNAATSRSTTKFTAKGHPFMFFCETACDCKVWKIHQVPEFARDLRVVTQDYRGTGGRANQRIKYTTADFVDDAIAILDHLNAGPAIV